MVISNLTHFLEPLPNPTPKQSFKAFQEEYFTTLAVLSYVWPAIILFGLVANVTNIIVFLKTGANDNVTVLLISLAMSDLTFLTLISPTMCGFVVEALVRPRPWPFDNRILFFLLYWPAFTVSDISTFISVSLGVMRCACVAMPLKFKLVFTRPRTIKWLFVLLVLAVLLRVPVLTIHRIGWRKNPITNITMPYLAAVNKASMSKFLDILNRGVVIFIAYITMVACVVILTSKLYQAAKLRQICTVKGDQPIDKTSGKPAIQGLSSRDMQVVKSVILVCTVFIIAQLPQVIISASRLVNGQVSEQQQFHYLFAIIHQINITCCYLNASVNIFVYYNYKSRYRSMFQSLLLLKHR
ncbi:chemosensory receptor A [Elysia marginata]|uniref:Chemosensory receptor A n=1 Tax=Elysia marginata TaxID=1093978 RepID=A0AAV4G0B8_9GAST|nr:chemosensory receptor A [Elysia marginata]